jgi:hypothetical protein
LTDTASGRPTRSFLLWGVTAWAILATLLVGLESIDSLRRDETGANRDPFDFYFENALSGSRDLKQTVTGLRPEMNIVAACFWRTKGIERFLDEEARTALERDEYYQDYRFADYVWRLVLISDDRRFRTVIMAQYEEPGEDRSQYGCHALADIQTIVTPPSLRNGVPIQGIIRLEKAD